MILYFLNSNNNKRKGGPLGVKFADTQVYIIILESLLSSCYLVGDMLKIRLITSTKFHSPNVDDYINVTSLILGIYMCPNNNHLSKA